MQAKNILEAVSQGNKHAQAGKEWCHFSFGWYEKKKNRKNMECQKLNDEKHRKKGKEKRFSLSIKYTF